MNLRRLLISALAFAILPTPPAGAQPLPAGQKPPLRFAKPVAYDTGGLGAGSVAVADLRGIGKMDLVVANGSESDSDLGEVAVLLGNGDGTFQSAVTYNTGAYDTSAVAVGDLRGNGILDLVVANACSSLGRYGNCVNPARGERVAGQW